MNWRDDLDTLADSATVAGHFQREQQNELLQEQNRLLQQQANERARINALPKCPRCKVPLDQQPELCRGCGTELWWDQYWETPNAVRADRVSDYLESEYDEANQSLTQAMFKIATAENRGFLLLGIRETQVKIADSIELMGQKKDSVKEELNSIKLGEYQEFFQDESKEFSESSGTLGTFIPPMALFILSAIFASEIFVIMLLINISLLVVGIKAVDDESDEVTASSAIATGLFAGAGASVAVQFLIGLLWWNGFTSAFSWMTMLFWVFAGLAGLACLILLGNMLLNSRVNEGKNLRQLRKHGLLKLAQKAAMFDQTIYERTAFSNNLLMERVNWLQIEAAERGLILPQSEVQNFLSTESAVFTDLRESTIFSFVNDANVAVDQFVDFEIKLLSAIQKDSGNSLTDYMNEIRAVKKDVVTSQTNTSSQQLLGQNTGSTNLMPLNSLEQSPPAKQVIPQKKQAQPSSQQAQQKFKIACKCGKSLVIDQTMLGKKVKCPGCQGVLNVPKKSK